MDVEVTSKGLTQGQRGWLEHLKASERNAQSMTAYANAQHLSVGAFYAAKRDLVGRGAWPATPKSVQSTLVAVRLSTSVTSSAALVHITLPNGIKLDVGDDVDGRHLRSVVEAIAGARA
jgi:hypothetical protein